MIRIAIVEDDPMYMRQLAAYLAQYEQESGERCAVERFTDGDEIAVDYKAEYDIILMDIELKFMDGMTAAQEIRRLDPEVIIIFITNMPQYAIKGYAVDALDYVLKPISYYAFAQRIDRAVTRMQRRRRRHFLNVTTKSGIQRLDVSQIYFIEVDGRRLLYHTKDGLISASGSMSETEAALARSTTFFRCNKGYLVNLEHVTGVQGDDALVGREKVPLSRSKKRAFLDAVNDYINEAGK